VCVMPPRRALHPAAPTVQPQQQPPPQQPPPFLLPSVLPPSVLVPKQTQPHQQSSQQPSPSFVPASVLVQTHPQQNSWATASNSASTSAAGAPAGAAGAVPPRGGVEPVPTSAVGVHQAVFSYPTFNPVQSACFERTFKSDDSMLVSAPTGSGKTGIMEIAICRLLASASLAGEQLESFSVIYFGVTIHLPLNCLCSARSANLSSPMLGLRSTYQGALCRCVCWQPG
jgi:hypothetical protein